MRKVLGVLLILISTIVGVVVLLGWGIRTSLLSSAPWKAGLRETRVYDRLLVEALPEIVAEKMVTDNVLEKAPLTPNDLVAIAQGTLSASFLQQQLERGLDVAFDLLHSRTSLSTTNFIIPLQDVKRQLPIAAQERLVARVQALPICVADQLKDFEKFKSLTDALPPCRPKGLDVAAIVRDSLKIDEITANIPATYDVVVELQKQRTADSNVKTPAQQIVADARTGEIHFPNPLVPDISMDCVTPRAWRALHPALAPGGAVVRCWAVHTKHAPHSWYAHWQGHAT